MSRASGYNYTREIILTRLLIALTTLAWVATNWELFGILWNRIQSGELLASLEQPVFIVLVNLLVYGNFVYQFTRLGYLLRQRAHQPAAREDIEAIYDEEPAPLTILVPSYKEEIEVVRCTLLSAALQDYPNRRVVLLIDDPFNPEEHSDQEALDRMRALPRELQATLAHAAAPFNAAYADYVLRRTAGPINVTAELHILARLYREAGDWFTRLAEDYPTHDHATVLLVESVFRNCSRHHHSRAAELERSSNAEPPTETRILREYRRLAAVFTVELTSFERKRYVNLSHECNKAMNLNSYIGLIGESWHEVQRMDGLHLEPTVPEKAQFQVPPADFLITLDADSILLPGYALRLTHYLRQPENARVAVAQTPYSTYPGTPITLERVAAATTDIQYLIHQGFTHYRATYWVGANALLRKQALDDIRVSDRERGFEIFRYIQDRTVIEDTESSVDLVQRGWSLFNYPERMAYSATPADFGSLLIQRRRWANGGLIILPKLLRYLTAGRLSLATLKEGFFRVHYLASLAVVNIGLLVLLAFPFEHSVEAVWLPLTALPYFALYMRDLVQTGYRRTDIIRVYALNLLLIPINIGGAFKSLQQAITGCKIPFGRTPKIIGRTPAPATYLLAEYALLFMLVLGGIVDGIHSRWLHSLFSLGNAALLAYAIVRFIGLRESRLDIASALQRLAEQSRLGDASLPPLVLPVQAVSARETAPPNSFAQLETIPLDPPHRSTEDLKPARLG